MKNEEFTARLRGAVWRNGGVRAIAAMSGVPAGSLGNYLMGREMRGSRAAAIAKACGVSVDWLLTGEGVERLPDPPEEVSQSMSSATSEDVADLIGSIWMLIEQEYFSRAEALGIARARFETAQKAYLAVQNMRARSGSTKA
jgi:hypothetical protein